MTRAHGLILSVEVFAVVEGVLDSSELWDEEHADDRARALAAELADVAALQGFEDWQVFTLPHYCGDTGDCECVQWLTDHRPDYSSDTWKAEA